MQTFTQQLCVNKKTFALESQILFPVLLIESPNIFLWESARKKVGVVLEAKNKKNPKKLALSIGFLHIVLHEEHI